MRDLLADMFDREPAGDPMIAARRSMRGPKRKRFYEAATIGEEAGGWAVLLDGRLVRTPARRALLAPSEGLAKALAGEWQAQGEWLDPTAMPLTRLANSILDGVTDAPQAVAADIVRYLQSDLLFYRADGPQGLLARQAEHWDPLIAWVQEALGARFVLIQGVTFVAQPSEAVAAAASAIPYDPWRLGALHAATTLTGSPLIALALAAGRIDLDQAWRAAHVDEDWNMDTWGHDDQVLERRTARRQEMAAAAIILSDQRHGPDRNEKPRPQWPGLRDRSQTG